MCHVCPIRAPQNRLLMSHIQTQRSDMAPNLNCYNSELYCRSKCDRQWLLRSWCRSWRKRILRRVSELQHLPQLRPEQLQPDATLSAPLGSKMGSGRANTSFRSENNKIPRTIKDVFCRRRRVFDLTHFKMKIGLTDYFWKLSIFHKLILSTYCTLLLDRMMYQKQLKFDLNYHDTHAVLGLVVASQM